MVTSVGLVMRQQLMAVQFYRWRRGAGPTTDVYIFKLSLQTYEQSLLTTWRFGATSLSVYSFLHGWLKQCHSVAEADIKLSLFISDLSP